MQAHKSLTNNLFTQTILSKQLQNVIARRCATNSAAGQTEKGRKLVGYWLLGSSGMVFVAVILGVTFAYALIIFSICSILTKYLPHSVKS